MKWWWNLLRRHDLFIGLRWFTLINVALLSLWFVPLVNRLLLMWVLPTLGLLYTIVTMTRIMLTVRSVGGTPNIGTVGFWFVSMTNFLFALSIVIPTVLNDNVLVGDRVTFITWSVTIGYAYAEASFFLVAHHSAKALQRRRDIYGSRSAGTTDTTDTTGTTENDPGS